MILSSNKRSERGFTLIELLVVIAIIGVLASVVLASLNNARRKSRDARRITDIKQIQLALELYFDGVGAGQYPDALAALATNNYIPQVPKDPSGGTGTCRPDYCYSYPSTGSRTTYHLGANLEDSNNPAVTGGDKDCDSGTAATCPGGAHTGGFDGNLTPDTIYDVIP